VRRGVAVTHSGAIALVGLGLVGTALAQRLLAAGFDVLGFDRGASARDAARVAGIACADELAALRACRVAVLAVFDTAGVLEVLEGQVGLASRGTLRYAIDCSTGDADALAALAARLRERGIGFIEAPLSGASPQIAAGQATMLLGGEEADIAECAAVLQALSPQRIHVGGAGMGARAKLATNLVLGLNRAVLAEGLVFAQQLGIAPDRFLELVLATPARSDAALAKGEMMVQGRFEPPQSRIRQHLKDVRLMLAAAGAQGQRLPLSETHAALMQSAVDAGDGDLDNAAIVRQLARELLPPRTHD
jgi:3-hydroxyisobutyrate dehydrogenase-like beta-hydroxyacid dehydrogenase